MKFKLTNHNLVSGENCASQVIKVVRMHTVRPHHSVCVTFVNLAFGFPLRRV